jgi:hypothetical protein
MFKDMFNLTTIQGQITIGIIVFIICSVLTGIKLKAWSKIKPFFLRRNADKFRLLEENYKLKEEIRQLKDENNQLKELWIPNIKLPENIVYYSV